MTSPNHEKPTWPVCAQASRHALTADKRGMALCTATPDRVGFRNQLSRARSDRQTESNGPSTGMSKPVRRSVSFVAMALEKARSWTST
jgi:hypothetical protein